MIFCPTSFTAYVGEDQNNAVIEYSLPKAGDNIDKNVSVFIIEGEEILLLIKMKKPVSMGFTLLLNFVRDLKMCGRCTNWPCGKSVLGKLYPPPPPVKM